MMADMQRKKLRWFIIPQSGLLILYLYSYVNFLFPPPSAKKVETETKATGNTVKQQWTRNQCLLGSEKIEKDTNHVFLCQPGHAHSFKELSQHGRFTL
ncbi:hypothetical protein Hanom_Chr03g00253951 [Helianthus anomalus]